MKWLRFLLLFLLLVSGPTLWGKHIIGGEITYECLGIVDNGRKVHYKITTIIYRDCYGRGAPFDSKFNFGLYYWDDTLQQWQYMIVHGINDVPLKIVEFLPINDNPCMIVPSNLCVERGIYEFEIVLPIRHTSYMIAFQRCCRNNTITNILNPGEQGAAYTVEITAEAQRTCNSSPVFREYPPVVICNETMLVYNHAAIDKEGDQLVYEFCAPLHAGGQRNVNSGPCPYVPSNPVCDCVVPYPDLCKPPFRPVPFKEPQYTPTMPMGGNPVIRIDPTTGLIRGRPQATGQYVVGVCVKEYRNGVLLSSIRRDFQFNVVNCQPTVVAAVVGDSTIKEKHVFIKSCGSTEVEIFNESFDRQYINKVKWVFDFPDGPVQYTSWDVKVTFPDTGLYRGKLILNEGLECSDSLSLEIGVFGEVKADYDYAFDTCEIGPVQFYDRSISEGGRIRKWNWKFGDLGESHKANPQFSFDTAGTFAVALEVEDNRGCVHKVVDSVGWYPAPPIVIAEPDRYVGCAPSRIQFFNRSKPVNEEYLIEWDFGDGQRGEGLAPIHQYDRPGMYSVGLRITSPYGCVAEAFFEDWIRIENGPTALYTYSPEKVTSQQTEVEFFNQSENSVSWQWIVDSTDVYYTRDLVYDFRDTGVHQVMLVAFHENGCTDTFIQYIDVIPLDKLLMPNVFTPNGDGVNDFFYGVGYFDAIRDFRLEIWDRWGSRVFATDNPEEGWDGTYQESGQPVPTGVYLYKVTYRTTRGKVRHKKGYVTLLR